MSEEVIDQCAARDLKALAVLDFTDAVGAQSPLGRYMAEQLAVRMVRTSNAVEVVDRQYLDKVIEEQQKSASGVYGGGNSLEIGKLVNANAVVTGKFVSVDKTGKRFKLTAVILDTERGTIVGSSEHVFDTPAGFRAVAEERSASTQTGPPASSRQGRVNFGFHGSVLLNKLALPKGEGFTSNIAIAETITAKRSLGWRFGMALETGKDRNVRFITGLQLASIRCSMNIAHSSIGYDEERTEDISLSVLQVQIPVLIGLYSSPFGSSRIGLRAGATMAINASSNSYEWRYRQVTSSEGVSSSSGVHDLRSMNTLSAILGGELMFENRTMNGNSMGIGLGYGYIAWLHDNTGRSELFSGSLWGWTDGMRGDYRPSYISIILQYCI